MKTDTFRRLLPYSGILSALLLIGATFGAPSAPQLSSTNHADVLAYYHDNMTAIAITSVGCGLLAAFFFAPFVVEIRATLRSGEAGEAIYSSLVAIGGTVLTAGFALMAMSTMIVASAADSGVSDDGVLALANFADFSWMPWVVGMAIFQWAIAIGGLRTATLPKWIAWSSIVLGALCLTGIGGIAVFFVGPIWMIALAVVLLRAQSASATTPAVAPTTA